MVDLEIRPVLIMQAVMDRLDRQESGDEGVWLLTRQGADPCLWGRKHHGIRQSCWGHHYSRGLHGHGRRLDVHRRGLHVHLHWLLFGPHLH